MPEKKEAAADEYERLHRRECRTRHRAYLIRKIAWRLQANAEGDLSERAGRRAAELADSLARDFEGAPRRLAACRRSSRWRSAHRSASERGVSRLRSAPSRSCPDPVTPTPRTASRRIATGSRQIAASTA